jgi:hypothetical protein
MSTTITVIALVARLKVSTQTMYGEATYRDKISDRNYDFTFKQFTNSQSEYNEAFKEGDLVLFGGKFTIDEQKLMVNIIIFT